MGMEKKRVPRGEKSLSRLEVFKENFMGRKTGRMGKRAKVIFTRAFRTENLEDRTRPRPALKGDNVNINADI